MSFNWLQYIRVFSGWPFGLWIIQQACSLYSSIYLDFINVLSGLFSVKKYLLQVKVACNNALFNYTSNWMDVLSFCAR